MRSLEIKYLAVTGFARERGSPRGAGSLIALIIGIPYVHVHNDTPLREELLLRRQRVASLSRETKKRAGGEEKEEV